MGGDPHAESSWDIRDDCIDANVPSIRTGRAGGYSRRLLTSYASGIAAKSPIEANTKLLPMHALCLGCNGRVAATRRSGILGKGLNLFENNPQAPHQAPKIHFDSR